MTAITLEAADGAVTPLLTPDTRRVDARALGPGATLVLHGGPALDTVWMPEDHPVDLVLERAVDAAPLTIGGRVGFVTGRIGPWTLPAVHPVAGRRVARGAYIGPAAHAPAESAVRVCTGPGAITAALRGTRGLVRAAFGDDVTTHADVAPGADPIFLLCVTDAAVLQRLNVAQVAVHTRLTDCPALLRVDGIGLEAYLIGCGSGARLDALGRWSKLYVERCLAETIRTRAGALFAPGPVPGLRSLFDTELYAGGPPSTRVPPLLPPPSRTVYRDQAWRQEIYGDALGDDPDRRADALTMANQSGFDSPHWTAQLRAALGDGVPVARVWALRRAITRTNHLNLRALLPAPSAQPDPSPTWPDDLSGWMDDLAIVEAAWGSDDAGTAGEAAGVMANLIARGAERAVRLLLDAARDRHDAGAPTAWMAGQLRAAMLHKAPLEPEPVFAPHRALRDQRWDRIRALIPPLREGLRRLAPAEGGRWLVHWLHHGATGEPGLDALEALAREGDGDARHALAEAALGLGVWTQDQAADALRRVLALGAHAA